MKSFAIIVWRILITPAVIWRIGWEWERLNFRPLLKVARGRGTHVDSLVWIQNGQRITLGSNVKVSSFSSLLAGNRAKISIGDNTILGPNCLVCAMNHGMKLNSTPFRFQPWIDDESYSISIGSNVWIGAGCIILPGAKIESDCVIAAGTIVTGNFRQGVIVKQRRASTITSLH